MTPLDDRGGHEASAPEPPAPGSSAATGETGGPPVPGDRRAPGLAPHEAEFDVVAGWTVDAIARRDHTSVIAAACRGSGSPAALAWLAESLQLGPDRPLLDIGAGLGGALAWAAERYQVRPLAVEPMATATAGAARLFGLPSITASATALPLPDRSVGAAWLLGVLDTVDEPDRALAEVRRVLAPDGRLGVLAYVATGPIADAEVPDGNRFEPEEELVAALGRARLTVVDRVAARSLPDAPVDWVVRQDRLHRELAARHGADERWQAAARQEARFARLLDEGRVAALLLHAVCV